MENEGPLEFSPDAFRQVLQTEGYTLAKLSRVVARFAHCSVTQDTLSNWITGGVKTPNLVKLAAVAMTLDRGLEDFLRPSITSLPVSIF